MAVRFNASGEVASRSVSFGNSEWAACGWAKLSADRNAYSNIVSVDNSTHYVLIETNTDGTSLYYYSSAGSGSITSVSVDEWFAWYLRCSGTTNGANCGIWRSSTKAWTRLTAFGNYNHTGNTFRLGNNVYNEWMNGLIDAPKLWSGATLPTAAQLEIEVWQRIPIVKTGLYGYWDFYSHSNLSDLSGNGNDLTAGGTLSTEDGAPIPWRIRRRGRIFIAGAVGPGTYTGSASLTVSNVTLAGSSTFTQPAYTGTSTLTVSNTTLAASATFTEETYTGTASLSASNTTLAASASFTAPTYTGTSSLTATNATLSASAIFANAVFQGTSALITSNATLSASATFTKPTYSGTASLSITNTILVGSAAFTSPTYSGSAALTISNVVLAASATFSVSGSSPLLMMRRRRQYA